MAQSCCPRCEGKSFEIEEAEPRRSAWKLMFVQCSSCGTVVGVQEYDNTGALIRKQNEAIRKIARALQVSVDL